MSDKKREVDEARQEMAKVDGQLLALLDRRAKLSRRVGELRKDVLPVLPQGERAQIAAIVAHGSGDMPEGAVRGIFREIFATCLALELPVPVAYAGSEGGTGHVAARARFGVTANYVPAETVAAALDEVTRQRAAFAVVPFETRADGPVQTTIVQLTASDLKIVACFELSQNLQLVGRTGNVADVEKVYATAADHALCERTLARELPKAKVLDVKSPLLACQFAAEDHGAAAIAHLDLATQTGLEVALKNVRDEGDDRVRYAVVGTRPSSRTGNDLTALALAVADAPGALHGILSQFAERGINLTRIQSRPAPALRGGLAAASEGDAWQYLFFIEVVGHATDRNVVAALEDVKRQTKFLKLLGSYEAP
ncbi:MAG: chorismate mutase [Myxococcales bacterium]|jgi:chorismate mutase/prephenate dehydratase|nr:chorismate mutase [Myxococcales bacterium]